MFLEKSPIVSTAYLDGSTEYPKPGLIAYTVLNDFFDSTGRRILTIDTATPWHVEATDASMIFDVLAHQVEDSNTWGDSRSGPSGRQGKRVDRQSPACIER